MSTENIIKFAGIAANNPELRSKLEAIHAEGGDNAGDRIAALSVEAGVPFTGEEFMAQVRQSPSELSDEELQAVAGGGQWEANAGNIAVSVFVALACGIMAILSSADDGRMQNCQISHEKTPNWR